MHKFISILCPYLLAATALFADTNSALPIPPEATLYEPWFTGPFLAPTPVNMPLGQPAIEPFMTVFATYGRYGNNWKLNTQPCIWSINPGFDFQFAFTERTGLEIISTFITNYSQGRSATHFQDTILFLGYQVLTDVKGTWIPNFRLLLQEVFPSGNYQKFDPDKPIIDSTGQGSYQTGLVASFEKLIPFPKSYLAMHWSLSYLFPLKVNVEGFNTYGGGYNTSGKVRPGQTLLAFLSAEYSLNQRWVLAFDSEFFYQTSAHFSGKKGTTASGAVAQVGLPSSFQISFAPEIEYNFSANAGLLTGLWFTLAGKNAAAFGSAFIAFAYEF